MRDAATQDRRRNERAKLWIFHEIAKWRRWRHAPRLTITAVITDSRHRFSKKWHVADVKNVAGDDQTTLMAHRNSANIACTFRFYVSLCLRNRDCCSVADDSGSCHAPAPSYFEEMTCCRRKKFHWRWPGNPNGRSKFRNLGLFTFTRSQLTLRRRLHRWWQLTEIAQTAHNRRQKHRRNDQDRSKFFPQIRKFMPTRSSKTSRKTSLCWYEHCRDWRHCALFFVCYHSQRILFSHSKNNFSTTLTPTKKPRYTYCRVFL